MKYGLYLLSLMLGGCLASCGSASEQAIEDTWTPIAYWEVIKGDSVIVCDIDKVEPTTTIPLELIAEDYQIVKLDKEAEDFSVLSDTYVTENYIGLSSYSSAPFKLFGKDGTFLTEVGTFIKEGVEGQGRYKCISEAQIDEAYNRIYILPENLRDHSVLMVYDLKGMFLKEIPLAYRAGFFCKFKVDTQKGEIYIIGTDVKSESKDYRVWVQDMKGNLIYGIKDDDKRNDDYWGNGTETHFHTEAIETFVNISIFGQKKKEFQYHWDLEERRLVPKLQTRTEELHLMIYELPSHYITEISGHALEADASTPKVILDKKTLKGSRFDGFVTPDGLLLNHHALLSKTHNGYFSLVEKESRILKRIEQTDKSKLTKEQRKKLDQLYQQLNSDKNDDTILFMAKFKK